MSVIRAIIVDDEPIARRGLLSFLESRADVEMIAECRNGKEAVAAIRRERPDLVLLDVQMPGLDGLGVVRTIGAKEMPCVVFITAFDEFAVRAFEVAAVDYVVKPYTVERLSVAMDRAISRIRERRVTVAHERLLEALGDGSALPRAQVAIESEAPAKSYAERLVVSIGSRSVVIPIEEVTLLQADGYHVVVFTAGGRYLLRESLHTLEERLDPARFQRAHRSTIVRVGAVRSVERAKPDQIVLQMADGTRVPVSRSRRAAMMKGLNGIHG
ncbi:MAG TPA: LytTR family DNA-binding domain-containing protein [Gemmatimonadaceae bacterium]|jgi:two-component system LytT family response regulator|nr:LytTR family DNA-binding domain-containing protein [Gemmatimonadaceae bacterium]